MNREQNGKPVALDRDSKHRTLLDNLHTMATRPPASEISRHGITQAELLQSTMAEANRPGESNQSSEGTCTVTSMQHALTARNPAEYVRLISGLTGPDGEVQLRKGDTLKRDEGSAAPDSATGRSHTERIFQSSMMEYSNGAMWNYDNASDKSTLSVGSAGRWAASAVGKETERGGLRVEEMKRGYDALFGTDAQLNHGDAGKLIQGLESQKPNTALLAMRWGTEGHSAHAVTFEKVENGRAYFRNPWGRNFEMQGTSKDPPPRQVEDGFTGLESMTVAEARQRLFAVIQE